MNYSEAQNHLVKNVYAPVFFNKLASDFGLRPTTEHEAVELLNLAGRLEHLEREYQTKQANERTNFVSQTVRSLDKVLGNVNATGPVATGTAYSNQEIDKVANDLTLQDELTRNAALLYADALSQSK